MATTEIKQFAGGDGANVLSQAEWAALTSVLANGFPTGILPGTYLNKVLRQAMFMAAGLAGVCVEQDISVPDDGDLDALVGKLITGIAMAAQPAGLIAPFAMSAAPSGWLECNGSAVSRTTYARLFAAIGTAYGTGNGTTTFNLPELRGEFLRGWDHGRNVDSGRTIGSAQLGSPIAGEDNGIDGSVFGGTTYNNVPSLYDAALTGYSSYRTQYLNSGITQIGNTGSFGISRPRNIAVMYCIRT